MEKTINIFCILAKTGGGKSEYINRIIKDKRFMNSNNISLLVYGTTRNARNGEKEGIDYYFHTPEEYDKITDDELVESRSYYTLNDGVVYYFTKTDYLNKNGNIICIASPYQYENYRNWCSKQNIRGQIKYNLNMIIIDTSLKVRMERILKRAQKEEDVYEMCRRVIQERDEFNNVSERVPELLDPMLSNNVCFINNDLDGESNILQNINTIKRFIRKKI